jgi:BioD-like phosphotransacetylase family protein
VNEEILEAARQLAAQLLTDVKYAAHRVEHIRLTARANEAAHLVEKMEAALTASQTDD